MRDLALQDFEGVVRLPDILVHSEYEGMMILRPESAMTIKRKYLVFGVYGLLIRVMSMAGFCEGEVSFLVRNMAIGSIQVVKRDGTLALDSSTQSNQRLRAEHNGSAGNPSEHPPFLPSDLPSTDSSTASASVDNDFYYNFTTFLAPLYPCSINWSSSRSV